MVAQNSLDDLQRQMHRIRRKLDEDADQMVEKARSRFDWRRYVARHPWTSLGAAAIVGYYLVPRRTRCPAIHIDLDSATVREAAERMASIPKPEPQSAVSGIVAGVANVVATTLVREGLAFVSQLVRHWLEPNQEPFGRRPAENV